jgi:hypothetical protein
MVAASTSTPAVSASPNNGLVNLGIYSMISVLYLWVDYMMPSGDGKSAVTSKPKAFAFIFLVVIWLTQFIITFLSLQQMCNSPNYGLAAWSSFATWIVLFVPLFWCLEYMYTWLRPFGNTFGYLIIKLNGLVSFMNSIVKSKAEGKIQEYLDYLKYDPWVLFSMLTTSEYAPDSVNASKKFDDLTNGYLKQDMSVPDAKTTFVNYVRAKESIAKFIFYVLTLNLMADITFVIAQENSPCAINIDEVNDAAAFKPPKLKPKATAKPAVVYKTSE